MDEQAPSRTVTTGWRGFDAGELISRLETARDLLRQAAALSAADEAATLAALAEQERVRGEEARRGHPRRRRYR
jgi:hypothetical protein